MFFHPRSRFQGSKSTGSATLGSSLGKLQNINKIFICCEGVNGGRDATATLFLLLDLATFFDLFHGGKLDEALDTLTKIKIIPLNQQDVDYLVAGL